MGDFGEENHHHLRLPELDIGFRGAPSPTMMPSSSMAKEPASYDMAELDQAVFLYLNGHDQSSIQEQQQTLNIFPSQPMHVEPLPAKDGSMASMLPNGTSSPSKKPVQGREKNPTELTVPLPNSTEPNKGAVLKEEGSCSGKGAASSSEQGGRRTADPKTLRRLAQNREAARKSRLRKKAYIQQLESSRIRLSHLEQDVQMARAQGLFLGGVPLDHHSLPGGLSSGIAGFDMQYGRWVEEHHKLMFQLRAVVDNHLPEDQLRPMVEGALAQHDVLISLKDGVIKSNVFHLMSGMWATPAERCFLWMGGFRPSELIKIMLKHVEPLSEQQILEICGLQQWIQGTEDSLNHAVEGLHQLVSDAVSSDLLGESLANFMGTMSVAMTKLSSMQECVKQADNLRQQTLHKLHQTLTTRQAARCYLAIADYFHRLRALSSLWVGRPRQDGM